MGSKINETKIKKSIPKNKFQKKIISNTENKPNEKDSIVLNQFDNGEKIGLWKNYYSNGNLKSENRYVQGKKEGFCKEWWENGKLWTEGSYTNDKANGLMKWYNQDGILVASGNMSKGERHGIWRICDLENTTSCIEANFKMGKKDGTWKIYHENGQLWKDQIYDYGTILFENCWDINGNKITCE